MPDANHSTGKPVGLLGKLATTVVLLLLFLGGGVYLTQRGLRSVEQSIASRDWPTVEGEVVRSAVHMTESPVKKNGREVPNKKRRSYSPKIEYRYTVKGQELTGTRVTIDDESLGTEASAQAIVDKYPAQAKVKVSYQPDQPATSVLEPGSWAGSYRWFVPGGLLLLIPLLILRAIWSDSTDSKVTDVEADENHPSRPHLLNGMLMIEEIVRWEPMQTIHIRRARVGVIQSLAAAIIMGLFFGLFFGLLPAILFLSGRGVMFMAQFYLAISAVIAVASTIGLLLYGRRREYLLDWALGTIHWEIGWSSQDAPLTDIESLILDLPAEDSPRNAVVDSYKLRLQIRGKPYTLVETNGNGQTWGQTRKQLATLTHRLAESLNIPWSELRDRSIK
jgi:Protein of unknown function (DUF3592)